MFATTKIQGMTTAKVSGASSVQANRFDLHATDTSTVTPKTRTIGAGLISGSGAKASAEIVRTTEAFVDVGSNLNLGNGVFDIKAKSTATSQAEVFGLAVGFVSVSVLDIESTNNNTTRAFVGDASTIRAGQLNVLADSTSTAKTPSRVFGIGLAAGAGMELDTKDTSTAEAYIGAKTGQLSASSTTITIQGGGVDVDAKNRSVVESTSDVVAVGLLGIAGVKTRSETTPVVKAYFGDKTNVAAPGGAVTIDADANAKAETKSSQLAVGLISIDVSTITAKTLPTVSAFTESGGSITAKSGAIRSKSTADASSTMSATNGGVISVSGLKSVSELTNRNNAAVGNGTAVDILENFTVLSDTTNIGKAESTTGAGGFIAVNFGTSELTIDDQTKTRIGDGASIVAIGDIVVDSQSSTTGNSIADVRNGGFIASPNSDANDTVTVKADTIFGTNVNMRGENLTLRARIAKLKADATAYASVGAAVPLSSADANVNADVSATVTFADMRAAEGSRPEDSITARGRMEILAQLPELDTVSKATSYSVISGVGTLNATANNTQKSAANITTTNQTRFGVGTLLVSAESDPTLVVTAEAERGGFTVIPLGSATETPVFDQKRLIDFSAKVKMLGAPARSSRSIRPAKSPPSRTRPSTTTLSS